MAFIQETLAAMTHRISRWVHVSLVQVNRWLGTTPNMDSDVASRRAAFELTGLRVDPRELIDLATGELVFGRRLKRMVRGGIPPQNALQSMILDVQFTESKRRKLHYAGFEHTLAREMGFAARGQNHTIDSKQDMSAERLRLLAKQPGESNAIASSVLIFFRFQGTERKSIREMKAARKLLKRWPKLP